MEPPSDRDIQSLRDIARRVGELARGRPEVAARLQRAREDYIVLHVRQTEERRQKELLQRNFAIGILNKGLLDEQPRKVHEPSWNHEIFRVRVSPSLEAEVAAAKTPSELAEAKAKVATAILKHINYEKEIVACSDPAKRAELIKRRPAAMQLGRSAYQNILVGFRPRPEFEVGSHPSFCEWREFQGLPIETRITVALATLVDLHDDVSAIPLLKPIPRRIAQDQTNALESKIPWGGLRCLSSTSKGATSRTPPRPDPHRLPVELAEAFYEVLRTVVGELGVHDETGAEARGERPGLFRTSPTLVGFSPSPKDDASDVDILAKEVRTASWIAEVVHGISVGRLRQMANRGKFKKAKIIDGKWNYNLEEIAERIPDCRKILTEAVEEGYRARGRKREPLPKKS